MQFNIFVVAALATAVCAAPASELTTRGEVIGRWTYHATTQMCNGATCAWKLSIDRHDGGARVPCSFTATNNAVQPERKCDDSNLVLSMSYPGWWQIAIKDIERREISYPAFNADNFHGTQTSVDLDFNVERLNL